MENRVQELVIYRGLPASGKSTAALKWVLEDLEWRVRVSRDDLRKQNTGKYHGLTHSQEETVTLLQKAQAVAALGAGLSVVVDDTNLRARTVRFWYDVADNAGVPVRVVDFDTAPAVCMERDALREKKVGIDVIQSFATRYLIKGHLPPAPEHAKKEAVGCPYTPDANLPKAFIFDIDGTIARMKDRSPYDWKRVGEDSVVESVVRVLWSLDKADYQIILMSGRDAVCRPETVKWLWDNGIPWDALFMRPEGSQTPDDKVKAALFDKNVRDEYNVVGVVDDRLKVCRMWENMGIPLFRVGPLDSNF